MATIKGLWSDKRSGIVHELIEMAGLRANEQHVDMALLRTHCLE